MSDPKIDPRMVKWEDVAIDPKGVQWEGDTKAKPAPPSNWAMLNEALKYVTPGGIAGKLLGAQNEAVDKAAYGLGEKATDFASSLGASPEVAGGAGYLANLGTQMIPMALGGAAARIPGQAVGRSLMQSAIKPTIADLQTGKAGRAVETMLREGRNPTEGGVLALRNEATNLGGQVSSILRNSPETVSRVAAAQRVAPVLQREATQAAPSTGMNSINGVLDEFLGINHPVLGAADRVPVDMAHRVKQGIYRSIGDRAYGSVSNAQTEAEKAIARGLREDIAAAVPQVAPLTARQSELLNAANVSNRRALLAGNNNPTGLMSLANNPASALGFLADRSTLVKSLLARLAYSGSPSLGRMAGGAVGAYSGTPED